MKLLQIYLNIVEFVGKENPWENSVPVCFLEQCLE